jgi:integrase
VASAWVEKRTLPGTGTVQYRVRFRLGGRESARRHGGSFATKREANARRQWIADELAAMRVPDLTLFDAPVAAPTLTERAAAWRRSRIDVEEGTAAAHQVNLGRILPRLGHLAVDEITVAHVSDLVVELHDGGEGLARESIRKTKSTLAMVLDFAGVTPNPARDPAVKLPAEDSEELTPPTAAHVLKVLRLIPRAYRLALLVLEATGMRIGELETLLWGDVDEPEARWRIRKEVSKTRRARWVTLADYPGCPLEVFDAVMALVPREDRDLAAPLFAGFSGDAMRTAIAKACKAAGVPLFSPHDLRHRRATLWHFQGVPHVQAAAWLGHSPDEYLKTYAHATLTDRAELVYAQLLQRTSVRDFAA